MVCLKLLSAFGMINIHPAQFDATAAAAASSSSSDDGLLLSSRMVAVMPNVLPLACSLDCSEWPVLLSVMARSKDWQVEKRE